MASIRKFVIRNQNSQYEKKDVKENRLFPRYNLILMTLTLAVADFGGLILAALGAVCLRTLLGGEFTPDRYFNLLPFVFIFLIPYGLSGLYPGVGNGFVDELRKLTLFTSLTVALITAYLFLQKSGMTYSRLTLILFWIGALALVPLSRWLVRGFVIRTRQWGEPIAIIGYGEKTQRIIDFLRNNIQLGYLPIANIHDVNDGSEPSSELLKVISIAEINKDHSLINNLHIRSAILVPTETPDDFRQLILEDRNFGLKKLILVSSLQWIGGSAVIARDLNGILGLELQHNLLDPFAQAVKFILTTIFFLATWWIIIPIIALCALFVHLDSKGSIFYGHKRIGRDGKEITVWKFRTMVLNADAVLEHCLDCNLDLREEWAATQKLKNDPRITRVGYWLRRNSLDELPQLWNVIKGEMSLVGPRPIVQDEVIKYKNSFRLYSQVKPGITGLWQISGRNNTTYDERVSLDEYYVRHWSVWMDIYILIRTFGIVLRRGGAY